MRSDITVCVDDELRIGLKDTLLKKTLNIVSKIKFQTKQMEYHQTIRTITEKTFKWNGLVDLRNIMSGNLCRQKKTTFRQTIYRYKLARAMQIFTLGW